MDRLFGKILVLGVVFLIFSCGQVGFITGGEDDEFAPKPVLKEINPPMASTNVSPKEITIPFNEFIQLNSPAKNITVIPADVTLEASVKGKTLSLKPITGTWSENTTYAIYLNRAVKDLNESNDSLMTYVFATGSYIDSLETALRVVDAYTNKPRKGITVGLYDEALKDDTSKISPRYVVMTNDEGIARFNYLQKGPFYAYAFNDDDRNTRLNTGESRGKLGVSVYADTAVQVIPEIRLMDPKPDKFEVKTNNFTAPSTWCLGFTMPLPPATKINFTTPQPEGYVWNDKKDSLTVFYASKSRSGKVEMIIEDGTTQDTVSKKYFFKDPEKFNYSTNLDKGVLRVGDTLSLTLIEAITSMDEANITVAGKAFGDSLYKTISPEVKRVSPNKIHVLHPRTFDSIQITIPPQSIGGENLLNPEEITLNYQIQPKNKVGTLIVKLDSIPKFGLLEVTTAKEGSITKIPLRQGVFEYTIRDLQPTNYSFKLIIDKDQDNYWSVGDIFSNIEAEQVIWFDSTTQIRANWDVEVKLALKPETE